MERLLYSSSPTASLKPHFKSAQSPPRLLRIEAAKLAGGVSFPTRRPEELRRVCSSVSCKYATNPSQPLPYLAESTTTADLSSGPVRSSDLVERISAESSCLLPKAITVAKCVLLSVIFTLISHPVFAPSASASLQAATKATGTVGSKLLLSSAWTGFFAGCLHTLSGPDHLAALAPLSIGRTRLESAAVGALWGCGHDAGQVIFGLMFLLLKDQLHIEILTSWGARVVGLTLLVIGVMGIKEALEVGVELEPALEDVSSSPAVMKKKKIGFATFATGIVHGLQPDALMMVLPALALPSRVAGAAFLVMFLIGTVVAMGSYTVFIGSCSQALKERVPRITEKLTWASSLVAIALGSSILVSQFFGVNLY
ncbi:Chloroplast protein FOR GROWTH AND FERTILITY 2 [Linum grandiflorum]